LTMLLAADGQFTAALAQNDTLLTMARGPDVLIDRARINIMRGDLPAAEDDLRSSLQIAPTPEAYLILGDVHRWQWEFADARAAYEGARTMNPGDRAVAAAFAQLERDERPAPVGVPAPDEESGWRVHTAALHDNAGIDYVRLGARRGVGLPYGFTASAGVEYRTLHEMTPSEELASHGFAADVALARTATHGSLLGSFGGHAGVVYHLGEDVMTMGGLVLRGGYQAWIAALEIATGPAYPTLLTAASLVSSVAGDGPLRERRLTLSAGGPVGPADAAITWQSADISDGNRRASINLSARYPLAPNFAAVYAGSSISYAERSQLYWDPDGYLSSAAGIGYTNRSLRGFSFAAQALFGLARGEG
ncbi:MAG: tetratricopeptide repeat protein, partial [Longimicrobiales bacterium]